MSAADSQRNTKALPIDTEEKGGSTGGGEGGYRSLQDGRGEAGRHMSCCRHEAHSGGPEQVGITRKGKAQAP